MAHIAASPDYLTSRLFFCTLSNTCENNCQLLLSDVRVSKIFIETVQKLKITFLSLNHIFAVDQFEFSACFWLFCKHNQGLNSALSEKDAAAALTQKGKKERKR